LAFIAVILWLCSHESRFGSYKERLEELRQAHNALDEIVFKVSQDVMEERWTDGE
jgi:hypothetical protein